MKKTIPLLLVAFFAAHFSVYSNTVSVATAQTVALNFFKVNSNAGNAALVATLSYTKTESDNTVDFYIFNITPVPGYVIVSATDNANPVIGYSTTSNFNADILPHIGMGDMLYSFSQKLYAIIHQQVPANEKVTSLWTAYKQGQNPNVLRSGSVGPLLGSIMWNQEPYYNALCPYNGNDGEYCVTGCVATAMAQIMKYWSYPPQGTGSYSYDDPEYGQQSANFGATTYNWTNMPDAPLNGANNDIATLMYQCGVSVAMSYGDDNEGGSGAYVLQDDVGAGYPCAQMAYTTYFSYNPYTIQGVYQGDYANSDWVNLLENELNANRVMQYEGVDLNAGGHTWVCDGYEANDMFDMNWGWGGADNGWFDITSLTPSAYDFSESGDAALIGIEPPSPVGVVATVASASVCPGRTTTLTAVGPASATYSWTPTTGVSCPTCATTSVSPPAYTVYTVTVDSAGILGYASAAVSITQSVTAGFSVPPVATCSEPASVTFINSSANATDYMWYFGDGTTSTSFAPTHSYSSYGSYTVKLMASNGCYIDSSVISQAVQINNGAPTPVNPNICSGQLATLTATGNGTYSWFDAAGSLLVTGTSYTTPVLDSNATYYVSSTIPASIIPVGPADNTISAGGYFEAVAYQWGIIFNCSIPQTLLTVDVYSEVNAARSIQLLDSNNNVLQSTIVNIPAGQQTVTLNFPIPAEDNLQLVCGDGSHTISLYRNNQGINFYPFISTDGTVVLTGSGYPGPGYYYYFYNWKLQQASCTTNQVPVLVTMFNAGNNPFTDVVSGRTVYFSPALTGNVTYKWTFGDGTSSTAESPSHTYGVSGAYHVKLIMNNGECSDTVVQTVSVGATGINNLNSTTLISLYPNPAKDLLVLSINTADNLDNCSLEIRNILGETIMTRSTNLTGGDNTVNMDVSNLASGVYLLEFRNGNETVTKRFVKVD